MSHKQWLYLVGAALLPTVSLAKGNLDDINKIRDQGFYHSEVMQTLQHLTDKIGPRLTNSPQMREANKWTADQLKAWGMSNVHLEGYEFGRGWSYSNASIDLLSPRQVSLHGIPVAWTPGSNGRIEGDLVYLDAVTKTELQNYRGKLAGKIVLVSEPSEIKAPKNEVFKRYSSSELGEMRNFNIAEPASDAHSAPDQIAMGRKRAEFREELSQFVKKEGVKAVIYRSWRDGGLINVFGHNHKSGKTFPVPAIIIEAEQYNMLARFLEDKISARVALNIAAQFHDDDSKAYNTMAEIPGSAKNPEMVMLGAHLDSWHASTGGVDNGAGVAITMEAMRILKAIGFTPKRTIRLGLWTGEEQGLYGSAAYVEQHLATRPKPTDPKELDLDPWYWTSPGWPITKLDDYDRLSAYFNIDNGSGKLRGIYTEGNVAVKPIFSDWFGALSDVSDGTITTNSTGGTDHESFDDVGLPGFQFIQDELDYMSRLHHTHIDAYDHVLADDMKQASVVLATFVYNAANAEDRMPRKPFPIGPSAQEQQRAKMEADKRARSKERKALNDLLK